MFDVPRESHLARARLCGLMCARAVLWQLNKWEVCVTPGTTMHKSSGGAALAGFRKLPKTSDSAQKSGRFVVGVREGSVRGCAGSGIPRVLRPAANRPFRPAVADPRFGVQRRSNSGENGTAKGPIRTRCGPGLDPVLCRVLGPSAGPAGSWAGGVVRRVLRRAMRVTPRRTRGRRNVRSGSRRGRPGDGRRRWRWGRL